MKKQTLIAALAARERKLHETREKVFLVQIILIIIISVQVHTRFHMKVHNKIFLVQFIPLVTDKCTISPAFHFINNLQWPEPKIYHRGAKFILLGEERIFLRDF